MALKLAIVGTRGIPNTYGGFETLAEYLAKYLSRDFQITVFCSSKDLNTHAAEYSGAKLKYVNVSSHGAAGILYDTISLARAAKENDLILLLAFGAGFALPWLKKYGHKLVVNVGGQDWKREKWSKVEQRLIKAAERNLVKHASVVVSDNIGIQRYMKEEYGRESVLIEYGGDQAIKRPVTQELVEKYPILASDYAFAVSRIQPDNNIDMVLSAFSRAGAIPLMMVGNWEESAYGREIRRRFSGCQNLTLHDAIYDRTILDVLRSNCQLYVHGHSAGGTNPSLVEAMFLGLPVFAYASGFNEFTTEGKAIFFKDEDDLVEKTIGLRNYNLARIGAELERIARVRYRWSLISSKYKQAFLDNR